MSSAIDLRATIPGKPVGAGRPRVVRTKAGASHTYMPDTSTAWEAAAVYVLRREWGGREPLRNAITVELEAVFARPKGMVPKVHGGTMTRSTLLGLEDAWGGHQGRLPCGSKPDADNVAKLALDALVKAGVVWDDAGVVDLRVRKVWAALGESPCLEVVVSRLGRGDF
jgi:Holliday junction resolvase RusA-like endonuclease